jgi:hypothetical protein
MIELSPAAARQLATEVIIEATRRKLQTAEHISRLDWVRKYRQWLWPDVRLDFTEHSYLLALYADESPEIIISKAAQMGASEFALSDAIWACDTRAANVLYLLPGTGDVSDFSTARVGLAIEASPYIASIIRSDFSDEGYRTAARDRQTLKRIRNRFLYLRHGSVKADGRAPHLKVAQVDLVVYDEFDEMDRRAPAIAEKRLGHSHLKWQRWISTPTLPDFGIDAELKASDFRQWHVRCASCRDDQPLLPFVNLIKQVDGAGRPTRWFHSRGHPEWPFVGCRKCGKPLDRTGEGRWIPTNIGPDRHGYHLIRLLSSRVDLHELIRAGQSYDEEAHRQWVNQDLGMPHQMGTGGYSATLLRSLQQPYAWPANSWRCAMGVDVGSVLHVVVRRFRQDGNGRRARRAVYVGTVDRFEDLDPLMQRYDVRQCVVDALPETREALRFAKRFDGKVKLAWYTGGSGAKRDEAAREKPTEEYMLDLDRTRTLDALWSFYRSGDIENSQMLGPENLMHDHLQAMSRVVETDRQGNPVARWVSARADHFAHADNYCNVALDRLGPPGEGDTALTVTGDGKGNGRDREESAWR